ncbi:MAG: hypothetical protein PF961_17740 [Planctomycetota bacterium]|jgi:hypothetical protein|nr:hypothetical protein [Planctomycetota bacterium]
MPQLDHQRFTQAELVLEELRERVLALATCRDACERIYQASEIINEIDEIEHLLEIHDSDSGLYRRIDLG